MRACVLLLCALSLAWADQDAASQLPNGANVPNPCPGASGRWSGVGYLTVAGGGALNAFGKDFQAAGNHWTSALCHKDSDGDGKTNGEELGDPHCTWVPGATPRVTTGISHPGICEPMDSPACSSRTVPTSRYLPYVTQKDWLDDVCKDHCSAFETTQDIRVDTLRWPQTKVPAQETTYLCSTFRFPDISSDFHVIASEPIINNTDVMHHMLVYGCESDTLIHGPSKNCDFSKCGQLILAWGYGMDGYCLPDAAGIRVGKTGFKMFMIQSHWNNPQKITTYTDSSGMKLYYTPHLRPHDMGMLQVGPQYLQIPPGAKDATFSSDCSSTCTSNLMKGNINVTFAFNHMHLLGTAESVELLRNGRHVTYLTNETPYHYSSPQFFVYHQEPVVVKPGDVIRTTCHYANPHNETVFYGEGTQEEMCYAFMTFYPLQNMPRHVCYTWRNVSVTHCDPATYHGCNPQPFYHNFDRTSLYASIMKACQPFGPCTDECMAAIKHADAQEPCMHNDDVWLMIKWKHLSKNTAGQQFLAALESCEAPVAINAFHHNNHNGGRGHGSILIG